MATGASAAQGCWLQGPRGDGWGQTPAREEGLLWAGLGARGGPGWSPAVPGDLLLSGSQEEGRCHREQPSPFCPRTQPHASGSPRQPSAATGTLERLPGTRGWEQPAGTTQARGRGAWSGRATKHRKTASGARPRASPQRLDSWTRTWVPPMPSRLFLRDLSPSARITMPLCLWAPQRWPRKDQETRPGTGLPQN